MNKCSIFGCNKPKHRGKEICEMHYMRMRRNGKFEQMPVKRTRNIEYKVSEYGCFEVTSHSVQNNGYFYINKNGLRKSMHRHIYEECFGEIPTGLVVRHKCDNKRCINPEHLEIGTKEENNQDAIKRDRFKKGENHPNSKLTDLQVKKIKRMINNGVLNKDLAQAFNVDRDTISNIKTGKSWKHITA